MSLIALTRRLHAGRSLAPALLPLIVLTVAVIVGLLAMHSLNTHSASDAGHHTDVVVAVAADDQHAGVAAPDEACTDCGSSHPAMMAMACVLALLVTVLLARLAPGRVRVSVPTPPLLLRTARAARLGLPPPSLTALCISRT